MSFIDEKKLEQGNAYIFIISTGNAHRLVLDRVTDEGVYGYVAEEMVYAVYQDKSGNSEQESCFFTENQFHSAKSDNKYVFLYDAKCQFKTHREVGIDKADIKVAEDSPYPSINRFIEDLQNVTAEEITKAFPQVTVE